MIKFFFSSLKKWAKYCMRGNGFSPPPTTPGHLPWNYGCTFFPVENCLGLGWLCYCNPAFCCYHFRRLALCAFIRKYMWQKNNEYLSIYHLRTVTRLLCSFSFCSLLSFRYSHFVTLILLLSFCYSHLVVALKSFISGYISLKVPTILRIFGNNIIIL